MCGIAGMVRFDGQAAQVETVRRMGDVIRHRGPDDSGEFEEGAVAFAHRRLSIIDVAGGHQPMATERSVIVFNGEIYNYIELRDELRARGHEFCTASDTEVILRLYEEYGPDCVARLNGMFAFVLYDRVHGQVLFARDHFGVKPLYLHATAERLLFASEIKALLSDPGVTATADLEGVQEYLTFQYVLGARTMFHGITKVLPGEYHLISLTSGAHRSIRYWEPRFRSDFAHTESYFVEQIRWLLADAVRLQIRSDVPIGTYLSGGIDSSLVTALASRVSAGPLQTFTGRFAEGPEFDETGYARMVAESCGASMQIVTPTEANFVDLLPRLVYHMDEPVAGPGLFPQYMVSREASRRVKVMLGGQGGDEIFGGYARYLVAYFEQAIKGAIQEDNEEAEHIVSLASILPNLPALRQYVPMLQGFWRSGLFEEMDRRYFRLVDRSGGALSLLSADFRACYGRDALFERFQQVFNHPDTSSYYNKMTHYDLVTNLPAL
ncbi:MAG: asparagine synthase (glutamine-hydrolyzing), partial [Gemmatimonadota bacterium]